MNQDCVKHVFEVQIESVFGGDRVAYVMAKSEEEARNFLSNKNVDYITSLGNVECDTSEEEARSILGLLGHDFLS